MVRKRWRIAAGRRALGGQWRWRVLPLALAAWLAPACTKLDDAHPPDAPPGVAPNDVAPAELEPPADRYANERFHIEHDAFIAADRVQVVAAADAAFLAGDDEVLGFYLDGKARAYDVRALSYHHVVNDTIGERAIAVTY